jgi:uncharacterized protein YjdB
VVYTSPRVAINKTQTVLDIGESETLVATIRPRSVTNKNVVWMSEDPSIATVDGNGLVTAVAAGETLIWARHEDGEVGNTCRVIVNADSPGVKSVTLNKTSMTLFGVGAQETLIATVLPSNAVNKNITWSSNNPSVVTVDSNGQVTAVAVGQTYIYATADNGLNVACSVSVRAGN